MVEGPAGGQVFTVSFWSVLGLVVGIVAGTLVVSTFYGDRLGQISGELQQANTHAETQESRRQAAENRLSVLQGEVDRVRQSADAMAGELAASRRQVAELDTRLKNQQTGSGKPVDPAALQAAIDERNEARRQVTEANARIQKLLRDHEQLEKLHVQLKRLYLELKKEQTGLGPPSVPEVPQP